MASLQNFARIVGHPGTYCEYKQTTLFTLFAYYTVGMYAISVAALEKSTQVVWTSVMVRLCCVLSFLELNSF